MSDPVDDPIRADVERRIRAVVEVAFGLPLNAVRAVEGCVRRRIDDTIEVVGRPLQFVKSFFDLLTTPAESVFPAERNVVNTDVAQPPDAAAAAVPSSKATDLPIEEYESLAASHVVARLDSLSPADLRRVADFEASHRGRRTVLGKIDQLLGESTS